MWDALATFCFGKPTHCCRTTNPISIHLPPSVWFLLNFYQIFIGHILSATIPRWDQDKGTAMLETAINTGYLSVPRLSRNSTRKGTWEGSIGHPIGRLEMILRSFVFTSGPKIKVRPEKPAQHVQDSSGSAKKEEENNLKSWTGRVWACPGLN